MAPSFFVIFSLSRCGSTAIYRALCCHAAIRCAFEPDFSELGWNVAGVEARMLELRCNYNGIKHVWDPSGWPFAGVHASSVSEMNRRLRHVLASNLAILRGADRIVFLRRRDQFARVVSDLLGQQTELWGPEFSDGRISANDEGASYRSELQRRQIKPIDPELVDWYVKNIPSLEAEFLQAIACRRVMQLEYEELFGPSVSLEDRLGCYRQLLDFIGISSAPECWNKGEVERLWQHRAKLNNGSTIGMIPNISELRSRFRIGEV